MRVKSKNIPYRNIRNLFQTSKARRKEGNTTLYSPDSLTGNIYYLEEGAVRIFDYQHYEKKTKQIILPNDLFGTEGFFEKTHYCYYAEPLTKVIHYRTLNIPSFELQLKINYGLCHDFFTYLENQKNIWSNRFLTKSYNSREVFIIQYIEELANKIGQPVGVEILIPFVPTHQDIAGILGTSRQTVTHVLRKLQKQNAIYYDRKRIVIRNADGKIKY